MVPKRNLIANGDFQIGALGSTPAEWEQKSPRPGLAPVFKLTRRRGKKVLAAAGNGRGDCVGHLSAPVSLQKGLSYRLRVRFELSSGLGPHRNLLFCLYAGGFNDGIFDFRQDAGGSYSGEGRFLLGEHGADEGDIRIFFRFAAAGTAWIRKIELQQCAPLPPRLVRIACTNGATDAAGWTRVLDEAAQAGADLVLLPEMMNGEELEGLRGPSAKLMSSKAAQHSLLVAGSFMHYDKRADVLSNVALLFDRRGRRIGRYDKVHPYSPEILYQGVTPGVKVPVFRTPFGTVGFMICYDSWFTDVAELLALKGAEIILFPNAGYYRDLMPARAADNGVRIAASSLGSGNGIWDTTGTEVTQAEPSATCHPQCPPTYSDVRKRKVGKVEMLLATLDLAISPAPHNWGGPMMSASGGRRNRRDQLGTLNREIEELIG